MIIERKFLEVYDKAKDFDDMKNQLQKQNEYRKGLKGLGISDWQLKTLYPSVLQNSIVATVSLSYILIILIFGMPGMLYVLPVRYMAVNFAEKMRVESLKKSSVKIKGFDVIASWKIMYSVSVMIPYLFLTCFIYFISFSWRMASTWTGMYQNTLLFLVLWLLYQTIVTPFITN